MVFLSYLPMMTYIVVAFLGVYERSPFHVMLGWGLILNGLSALAISTWALSPQQDTGYHCVNKSSHRLCEESGMVFFVFTFYYMYDLFYDKDDHDSSKVTRFFLLILYALSSSYSQAALGLYAADEVIIGGFVGAIAAFVISILLYFVVAPNLAHPAVQTVMGLFMIDKQKYSTKPK